MRLTTSICPREFLGIPWGRSGMPGILGRPAWVGEFLPPKMNWARLNLREYSTSSQSRRQSTNGSLDGRRLSSDLRSVNSAISMGWSSQSAILPAWSHLWWSCRLRSNIIRFSHKILLGWAHRFIAADSVLTFRFEAAKFMNIEW